MLREAGLVNAFQNRFEYQNKEKESTFNLRRIGFGARTYNASIGRFDRMDPLSDLFENHTGYHYTLNNPINIIDIFGLTSLIADQLKSDEWKKFDTTKDVISLDEVTVKRILNLILSI